MILQLLKENFNSVIRGLVLFQTESLWAGEIVHQVKALAAKPDDLNSILDPHGGMGENRPPQVVL